jgi:hypothetical protein
MGSVVGAVRTVTNADEGIREGVQDKSLGWLLASPACEKCTRYLIERGERDTSQIDLARERYRGGSLLFILAAMQFGSNESVLEALRPLATRNVETRGLKPTKRLQKAGEARRRPITSERHYARCGHAARMQQQVADELYNLISHLDLLEIALAENGETAVARYL